MGTPIPRPAPAADTVFAMNEDPPRDPFLDDPSDPVHALEALDDAYVNEPLSPEEREDALNDLEDLEIFRSRRDRYHEQFGVALFDIDHFKSLNDAAGHLAGDEALRRVAAVIRRELREADMAYRYGGEELLVALPAGVRRVAAAAERIRKAVEHAAIPHPGRPGPETVMTLSVGVAAAEGETEAFLLAADSALYKAKSDGRNRMAVAGRWFAIPEMAASP